MALKFDQQLDYYHRYHARSEYEYDDGTEVIPLCKPARYGAPHYVVVQMHAPVGVKTVDWEAWKTGTPPLMPAMADTPSGDKLMGGTVVVEMPQTLGARTDQRAFLAHGQYRYAQAGVPVVSAGVPVDPLEASVGVARGAVVDALGTRKPMRLQATRPPFPRIAVDAFAASVVVLLAAVPLVGGVLARIISTVLDGGLNILGRSNAEPDLTTHNFNEFGVDYRPNYFTDGVIR